MGVAGMERGAESGEMGTCFFFGGGDVRTCGFIVDFYFREGLYQMLSEGRSQRHPSDVFFLNLNLHIPGDPSTSSRSYLDIFGPSKPTPNTFLEGTWSPGDHLISTRTSRFVRVCKVLRYPPWDAPPLIQLERGSFYSAPSPKKLP